MRTRKIMTPVIMLTARSEEYDKLTGLRAVPMTMSSSRSPAGAGRLCQAVLARTMPKPAESTGSYTFGDLSIDTASHSVKVAGQGGVVDPEGV